MKSLLAPLIILISLVAASVVHAAPAEPLVSVIRTPAGGIHPQGAIDSHGRFHMIYCTGDASHGDVFYVRSDDGGKTFSAPVRVNSQPGSVIFIGTVRGPQIAIGKGDRVHVAWMGSDTAQPRAGRNATPMLYSRTNDAATEFEPQKNVIQTHPGLDGGGSIAADSEGNVYIAWHAPDTEKTEADRRVWITRSHDEGKTFEPEAPAMAEKVGACGCCGMRIAAGANGRVYVLFRSATEMVHRDMYLLASDDYGKTFKVVMSDPWNVGVCVMSTSALAPTAGGVLAAWETHEQINLLNWDARQSTAKPVALPGPARQRKHPSAAINGRGEYVVAWIEESGWNKGGIGHWQAFDQTGAPLPDQSGQVQKLGAWDVPAVFAKPDDSFGVVF